MLNMRTAIVLLVLTTLAQGAAANTVWFKDQSGNVCKNSGSTNPDQVVAYGGVDRNGVFTLTISNPSDGVQSPGGRSNCANLPTTGTIAAPESIVFSGTVTPEINAIHMIKAGTEGRAECLAQGDNLTGISNTMPLVSGPYSLTLTYSYKDGCILKTGERITPSGQPDFTRTAFLDRPDDSIDFDGGYYIYNPNAVQPGAVPEPDSLWLILAGAASAGMLRFMPSRRKRPRQS